MKIRPCVNILLFPVSSHFSKLSFRKKYVFPVVDHLIPNDNILGTGHFGSFLSMPSKTAFLSKVYTPLTTVSLAPI